MQLVKSKIAHSGDEKDICRHLVDVEDPNKWLYRRELTVAHKTHPDRRLRWRGRTW